MDSYGVFSFLIILKEAFQLLPKNGKLMALVTLFSVFLSVITFVAFRSSILHLSLDMASTAKGFLPDPSSFHTSNPSSFTPTHIDFSKMQDLLHHMKQFMAIIYAVEIAFIFIFLVISFFLTIATVIIAAASAVGNTLSLKDLLSRIAGTWTKPLLTSIYVSIHALGFLAIAGFFAFPAFLYPNIVTVLISVFVAIVIFLFYLYLTVVWVLAVVVSVVEKDCYGMGAMGKASELIKGQRLKGYMLNLSFLLLSLIMLLIYLVIFRVKGPSSAITYGLFMVGFSYMVKILQVVAYTVLYFHSKKQHGENPEIIGLVKYELLPTTDP